MGSAALVEWRGERARRIARLLDVHALLAGRPRADRRWSTEQLAWALVLRVAAEFQGFARSLHDEAAEHFATRIAGPRVQVQPVLLARFTADRALSRGNAHPGALGGDFGRLGLDLWPALRGRYVRADHWSATLEALNAARNAIAHSDEAAMNRLSATGWPLSRLTTIARFLGAADGLAAGIDTVVGEYLARTLGGPNPW